MKTHPNDTHLNLKELFPFELDDFQKQAIAALDAGKSVVVCAPTGSGKTLIGEYAIHRALTRQKRVFYTTPLKALSNQKFRDFSDRFGSQNVGLITGDVVIQANAAVVVMTTEIFRNMLYETPIGQVGTSLEEVETVVLDECHYISDRGRGTVWEESIIYCPPTIALVALSASIGNPEELTDWIDRVHNYGAGEGIPRTCELVNSNFRPVPLKFYFSKKNGLFPLLNEKQTQINQRLLPRSKNRHSTDKRQKRRYRKEDCPRIEEIIEQLQERDLLPAIYVIFSRRGCEQAVQELQNLTLVNPQETATLKYNLLAFFLADNLHLQEALLAFLAEFNPTLAAKVADFLQDKPDAWSELLDFWQEYPETQTRLFEFLADRSRIARIDQIEPLLGGIAVHHAGILPAWKELVERLFEAGLVKVVFATATLSAGINMPARTTVISSLSKRTDDGHQMLTPSEFLQIAGRAGRRGMDEVGYAIAIQTMFEGAKEAAYLAISEAEPLRSCFTPSYGMVLNLLQKHSLEEIKKLLARTFAEYLAQKKLAPRQQEIGEKTTELTQLEIELAAVDAQQFSSYQKLAERLKVETKLAKVLRKQAEDSQKQEFAAILPHINSGSLLFLKGKDLSASSPIPAILVQKIPGSGQAPYLICLGANNRWYVIRSSDVVGMDDLAIPASQVEALIPPANLSFKPGSVRKGDETSGAIAQLIKDGTSPTLPEAPEVIEQERRVEALQTQLDNHPLHRWGKPSALLQRRQRQQQLRDEIHSLQTKYRELEFNRLYYWQDFLNLIEVLKALNALEGLTPTPLGEAAAVIRGENELWLGLAFMSGNLDDLAPHQLAEAICALITENVRDDHWTNYQRSPEVTEALSALQKNRKLLIKTQREYRVTMPVWLERDLVGLVEHWTLGIEWHDLCENTSLDEGDLVRLLRRTIDVLWQIPQVPGVSQTLQNNAKTAIKMMKRFPV